MKILVTGGAGFIGSHLIEKLLKEDFIVHSIDNYSTGKESNHHERCIYYNKNNLPLFRKLDAIIHLAAQARIQISLKDPAKTLKNNINAFIYALELARFYNAKFIYASSNLITKGIFLSPYACSKYIGEQLSSLYECIYNINVVGARFFNVYGPGQCEEGDNASVIGIFEKAARENRPLPIVGDGTQSRDFIHIDDIVEGLFKMIIVKTKPGMLYEFGRGIPWTINEIADLFGGEKIYIKSRQGEYDTSLSVSIQAKTQLDWEPKKDLQTYIKQILNSHTK